MYVWKDIHSYISKIQTAVSSSIVAWAPEEDDEEDAILPWKTLLLPLTLTVGSETTPTPLDIQEKMNECFFLI